MLNRFIVILIPWLCCGLVLAEPTASAASEPNLAGAINKAGRQRMLSQRIVLNFVQAKLGVQPSESRERLDRAIALFETQLAELKALAPSSDAKDALDDVEAIWQPFRAAARMDPTQENMRRLLYRDDDLLYASHKVVRLLQDHVNTPYARLVNISGRQRMLSQRLAKFYMLRESGVDTLSIRDELERARNEFSGALARLRAAPENTEAIDRELDAVELQWLWFDAALDLQGAEAYRLVIAETSEKILTQMDKVTQMYERLFAR